MVEEGREELVRVLGAVGEGGRCSKTSSHKQLLCSHGMCKKPVQFGGMTEALSHHHIHTHTTTPTLHPVSTSMCRLMRCMCVCVFVCSYCIVFSQVTDALAEKVVDSSELCGVKITRSKVTWGNAVVVVPYWSALASASLPPPASLEQTLSYTHV